MTDPVTDTAINDQPQGEEDPAYQTDNTATDADSPADEVAEPAPEETE